MQTLTQLLVCLSEGMSLFQSQSLWWPHFEKEQKRFRSSSHMPAFTQAMQACDESHLLPSLTLNRLSSLFALQMSSAHPNPTAKSGKNVTGSTGNSPSRSAHMTVSTSACMSKASPEQLAPEILDETAPQGCSEEPLNSQKHPSQPLQDTACLQSVAQTDPHPYDEVSMPQPHVINTHWRPTGLQEAESSGKQSLLLPANKGHDARPSDCR
ncbi:hypothetical protein WJX82_002533 [Trebouxia sp. C0006]